jgi:hypothetical protein
MVPHLRKRGWGTIRCSPAGYGCSRLTAVGYAQYAPKSVGVIVATVLSVAGSRGRRVIGFA